MSCLRRRGKVERAKARLDLLLRAIWPLLLKQANKKHRCRVAVLLLSQDPTPANERVCAKYITVETVRNLLQQFETIIHKEIQDAKLSKLVNDFYDSEKEAIEKVVEVVENDIFFATPYFATSNGINNEIIKELDNDYHSYSNENALEAGIPYIKNSNSTVVSPPSTKQFEIVCCTI